MFSCHDNSPYFHQLHLFSRSATERMRRMNWLFYHSWGHVKHQIAILPCIAFFLASSSFISYQKLSHFPKNLPPNVLIRTTSSWAKGSNHDADRSQVLVMMKLPISEQHLTTESANLSSGKVPSIRYKALSLRASSLNTTFPL